MYFLSSFCTNKQYKDLLYKIQTRQTLTASYKKKGKGVAVTFLEKVKDTPEFRNLFCTSDEAHFNFEEKVNSKTTVFWKTSTPNKVATMPLDSLSSQCVLQF